MSANLVAFNRGVVNPIECLKAGWAMIKEQYWLFMGITAVGLLIGSMGPLGIILGPMMCGIWLCLLRRTNNEPVSFDMLFKGFDFFIPSLIATLIQMAPMLVLMVPTYIIFFIQMNKLAPRRPRGAPPDPSALVGVFATFGVMMLVIVVVSLIVGAAFVFTYPLIVERKLSGLDALRTSARAVAGNLGGVVGLLLINFFLGFIGLLLCYVGAFLFMPVGLAAWAVAYRRVFPPVSAPVI